MEPSLGRGGSVGSSLWAGQSPSLPPAPKPGNKDFPLPPTPPLPPPGPSRREGAEGRQPSGPREEASSSIVLCGPPAAGRGHVVTRWSRASLLGQVASGPRGRFLVIEGGPHDVLGRPREPRQLCPSPAPATCHPPVASVPPPWPGRCPHMCWLEIPSQGSSLKALTL